MYRPNDTFSVPMYLFVPTNTIVKGVPAKIYPETGELFFGSYKTFGGTESNVDGLLAVVDTATIETWYRPDIQSDCHICLAQQPNKMYEIIGEPENISLRNQYLKFKVQAVAGGA